jgi:TIR domain
MAKGLFINYRREDTIATAGRLNDRLAQTFGKNQIFMDVDHIPAGVDFTRHIDEQLANCAVFLTIIGPRWLEVSNNEGVRRLFDPRDFVAREIGMALKSGVVVIPVLVDGAVMPRPENLPQELAPLALRNAVELRNTQFGSDADRLVGKIFEALKVPTHQRWWRMALVGTPVVALLAWITSLYADKWWPHFGAVNIENCDKTLGSIDTSDSFSGVFSGVVVESVQGGAEVQVKLVRNQNTVKGSYLRGGMCGTIVGEIVSDRRMIFRWNWAGNAGRGIATVSEDSMSGTSGFKDQTEGGGTFILFRRKSG